MGKSNEDSIFLNSDGICGFDSLNQLDYRLTDEESITIKKLVLGGWKKTSWLGKCIALIFLGWIAVQQMIYLVPSRRLKAMLARFHSKKSEQPVEQQDQKMAA